MGFERGQVVISRAGRDAGKLFRVMDMDGDFLLLADGKTRKMSQPKRKRRKHVVHARAAERLLSIGEAAADKELRRALASCRDEIHIEPRR